ncbi:hypothetical protein HYH03_016941 [Edaphochlamys debaryana]|uniref:EF-hand domain-containing protein n=1 Tax=Edaphochlamys debaryana TaxID=47281 RepID=A0A835XL16_9CHLO|nr:hypothetical protein HYH03_016941 [Edaphochlamys debaryana]|eukprot:KAG2484206.1 hypothetical protein HYH03_016941 [Edaphochlamys debaryana]
MAESSEAQEVYGWEFAVLFLLFMVISIVWQIFIAAILFINSKAHSVATIWLRRLKEEVLDVGVISLILVFVQPYIANICVDSSASSAYPEPPSPSSAPLAPPARRLLMLPLTMQLPAPEHDNFLSRVSRRLLAGGSANPCPAGQRHLFPTESIAAAHYLLFFVALVHIVYSLFTFMLTLERFKQWGKWERRARMAAMDAAEVMEADAVRHDAHCCDCTTAGRGWCFRCFVGGWNMLLGGVDRDRYMVLRGLFQLRARAHRVGAFVDNLHYVNVLENAMQIDIATVVAHGWLQALIVAIFTLYPTVVYQILWIGGMSMITQAVVVFKMVSVINKVLAIVRVAGTHAAPQYAIDTAAPAYQRITSYSSTGGEIHYSESDPETEDDDAANRHGRHHSVTDPSLAPYASHHLPAHLVHQYQPGTAGPNGSVTSPGGAPPGPGAAARAPGLAAHMQVKDGRVHVRDPMGHDKDGSLSRAMMAAAAASFTATGRWPAVGSASAAGKGGLIPSGMGPSAGSGSAAGGGGGGYRAASMPNGRGPNQAAAQLPPGSQTMLRPAGMPGPGAPSSSSAAAGALEVHGVAMNGRGGGPGRPGPVAEAREEGCQGQGGGQDGEEGGRDGLWRRRGRSRSRRRKGPGCGDQQAQAQGVEAEGQELQHPVGPAAGLEAPLTGASAAAAAVDGAGPGPVAEGRESGPGWSNGPAEDPLLAANNRDYLEPFMGQRNPLFDDPSAGPSSRASSAEDNPLGMPYLQPSISPAGAATTNAAAATNAAGAAARQRSGSAAGAARGGTLASSAPGLATGFGPRDDSSRYANPLFKEGSVASSASFVTSIRASADTAGVRGSGAVGPAGGLRQTPSLGWRPPAAGAVAASAPALPATASSRYTPGSRSLLGLAAAETPAPVQPAAVAVAASASGRSLRMGSPNAALLELPASPDGAVDGADGATAAAAAARSRAAPLAAGAVAAAAATATTAAVLGAEAGGAPAPAPVPQGSMRAAALPPSGASGRPLGLPPKAPSSTARAAPTAAAAPAPAPSFAAAPSGSPPGPGGPGLGPDLSLAHSAHSSGLLHLMKSPNTPAAAAAANLDAMASEMDHGAEADMVEVEKKLRSLFWMRRPQLLIWLSHLNFLENSLSLTLCVYVLIADGLKNNFLNLENRLLYIWFPLLGANLAFMLYIGWVVVPAYTLVSTTCYRNPRTLWHHLRRHKKAEDEEEGGVTGFIFDQLTRCFMRAHHDTTKHHAKHGGAADSSALNTLFMANLANQAGVIMASDAQLQAKKLGPAEAVYREYIDIWRAKVRIASGLMPPAENGFALQADVSDFRSAFMALDADGSSTVTTDELFTHLHVLGTRATKTELKSMITQIDNDGDKKVDFDEFVVFMVFCFFDENGNSCVEIPDIRKMCRRCKLQVPETEVNAMMDLADPDGDRKIGLRQFFKLFKDVTIPALGPRQDPSQHGGDHGAHGGPGMSGGASRSGSLVRGGAAASGLSTTASGAHGRSRFASGVPPLAATGSGAVSEGAAHGRGSAASGGGSGGPYSGAGGLAAATAAAAGPMGGGGMGAGPAAGSSSGSVGGVSARVASLERYRSLRVDVNIEPSPDA